MRSRNSRHSARHSRRPRVNQPAYTRRAHFEALEDRCLLAVGAELVKDIRGGSGSSSPRFLTNVNGTLYFQATDGVTGLELWKSDAAAAGTALVKDIQSGSGSSRPYLWTNVEGTLYFSAGDNATGSELWKSDGTAAGTVLVKDIRSGSSSS